MKYFLPFFFSFIFLETAFAQPQTLELSSLSGTPVNGPNQIAKTLTFYNNTDNPGGTTFSVYTPTTTATFSISNQQFSKIEGNSTVPGLNFGGTTGAGNTVPTFNDFLTQGSVGSPSANQFSSSALNINTGISLTNNYAMSMMLYTDALINSSGGDSIPINAKVYYGDITITFNKPVSNPIIHISGMGGDTYFYDATSGGDSLHNWAYLGYSARMELAAGSSYKLRKLSGSTYFSVNDTSVDNSSLRKGALTNGDSLFATPIILTSKAYGASGSVMIIGNNITTVKFRMYLVSDGGSFNGTYTASYLRWAKTNITSGERFLIGVDVPLSVQSISGTIFNDANGITNSAIDGTPISNASGTQLYVSLVNSSGTIVQTLPINPDGTYNFAGVALPGSTYTVVLGTNAAGSTTGNLPQGWSNTSEAISPAFQDGTNDGITSVAVGSSDVTGVNFGLLQPGYIYVHKKALNESASIDFPFSVSGGITIVPPFILNDLPAQLRVTDIGASQNGRLWAIDETTNTLYYRDVNNTIWIATSITDAKRVDGDINGNAVYINTSGTVFSTDGITTTPISAGAAYAGFADIGSGWDGLPFVIKGAIIYQYSGVGTTWNTIADLSATYSSYSIDVNPLTRDAYVTVKANTTGTVSVQKITAAGVITNIGAPSGIRTFAMRDIAVNDKGEVFIIASSPGWYVYKYNGTWSSAEMASYDASGVTGGVGGELWTTMNSGGQSTGHSTYPYYNIFTRATDGSNTYYIDDERVRTTSGNSILIPVIPGTYTITEAVSSGWDLQTITLDDPTANSTSNQIAGTATINVAAGETINAIFQNGQLNPIAMTNDCSASYHEDFGTGSVGTFGSLVPGQTSYHFLNTSVPAEDGYCKIVSTAFPDFNTWQAAPFYDHTSGDGTGRMFAVNAGYDKGEFFRRRFTGVINGATYNFSAWVANLTPAATIKPNVKFQVVDHTSQAVLATYSTGDINTATPQWNQYGFSFTATSADIDLILSNNGIGGDGNDLVIDDINFTLIPVTTPVTTVTHTGCGTLGNITVTSPVGASYEYSKDGFATAAQSSPVFNNLTPGSYTISARFVGTVNCISSKTDVIGATICGNVWDDGNGNAINTGENPITSGVWVNLVDPLTHAVLQSVQVDASGNYSFIGLPQNTSYQVILTATDQTGNLNLTAATIPTSYAATGTNLSGTASTANTTGVVTVNTGTGGITQQNFGLEKLPDSDPHTTTISQPLINQVVPLNGGSNPPLLSGSDPEDGTYTGKIGIVHNPVGVAITSLPTNGQLLYNGAPIIYGADGINPPSPTNPFIITDPALLSIKLTGSDYTSTSFTYAYLDAAGEQDPTPATYTLNWLKPLPITLESFYATKENDKVKLSWRTLTESNVNKFVIEYSKDGITFTAIAEVAAIGNSSLPIDYSWLHNNPVSGNNYYRLKTIDLDGRYTYSIINNVKVNNDGDAVISVYPNPAHNVLTILLPKPATAKTILNIYSSDGRLIYNKATGKVQNIQLSVNAWASGVYYIRLVENETVVNDTKFVKE